MPGILFQHRAARNFRAYVTDRQAIYYAPRAATAFRPAHSKTMSGSGGSNVSPNGLEAQIRRLMPKTVRAPIPPRWPIPPR